MKHLSNHPALVYDNNRLEMPDTKLNGTINTSVKNCDSVLNIESEIYHRLKENGGYKAVFTFWSHGNCYTATYLLSYLETYKKHFTN